MQLSDDALMAYADGELDAATSADIDAAMDEDSAVAAAIDRHLQLRQRLRSAFDTAFDGEIPERLIDVAHTAPAASIAAVPPAIVTDIAPAPQSTPGPRWSWREWGAIAASVLIGLVLARMPWDREESIVASADRITADGELAEALNQQLAGARVEGSEVRIGLSYRSKAGRFCRTFVLADKSGVSGVACREPDAWHVIALASSEPITATDRYRMAGTTVAPLVLQVVQDSIDGSALDATAEAHARTRGWR